MLKRVLSLDPGGTTGYVIANVPDDAPFEVVRYGQIKGGLQGFISFYNDVLLDEDLHLVVCESFTLREGIYGADLTPVYIIGALEVLYQDVDILYQEPKLKPLCDDDRLKRLGLHQPGKQHYNDAIRHLVVYLRNRKHLPTLEAGWK